jgi:hypothetical protein
MVRAWSAGEPGLVGLVPAAGPALEWYSKVGRRHREVVLSAAAAAAEVVAERDWGHPENWTQQDQKNSPATSGPLTTSLPDMDVSLIVPKSSSVSYPLLADGETSILCS